MLAPGFRLVEVTAPDAVRRARKAARADVSAGDDCHPTEAPVTAVPWRSVRNAQGFAELRACRIRRAALADCIVYPSKGPSPLDLLRRPDGALATAWRLGISPGHVKHEGTQTMPWALELIAEDVNPGRHIKGGDAYAEGE